MGVVTYELIGPRPLQTRRDWPRRGPRGRATGGKPAGETASAESQPGRGYSQETGLKAAQTLRFLAFFFCQNPEKSISDPKVQTQQE